MNRADRGHGGRVRVRGKRLGCPNKCEGEKGAGSAHCT